MERRNHAGAQLQTFGELFPLQYLLDRMSYGRGV